MIDASTITSINGILSLTGDPRFSMDSRFHGNDGIEWDTVIPEALIGDPRLVMDSRFRRNDDVDFDTVALSLTGSPLPNMDSRFSGNDV